MAVLSRYTELRKRERELIEIDLIPVLIALYLSLNLIAACVFAGDKRRAKTDSWRTTENTLLVLAFLGPFGAFLSMRFFRHKTRKIKFWLVPFFLVLHLGVIGYLIISYW